MKRIFTFLACSLMMLPMIQAQSAKKQVTMTITREANGLTTTLDTSFYVNDASEVEEVLRKMGLEEPGENQTLEKRIVIKEVEEERSERTERTVGIVNEKTMIGVYLTELDDLDNNRLEVDRGVYISGLTRGGGAEAAGVEKGDVILFIDGKRISSIRDIGDAKEGKIPGDRVRITVLRDGVERDLRVELKGKSQNQSNPYQSKKRVTYTTQKTFLGVVPHTVSRDQAERLDLPEARGIYLSSVVEGHSAEAAGLERGDVITRMDGRTMYSSNDLTQVLKDREPGDRIDVEYYRDGRRRTTTVKLGYKEQTQHKWVSADQGKMITERRAYLGVYLETDNDGDGVRITRVINGAAAEEAGLEDDDVIIRIGQDDTPNYNDLVRALRKLRPGERVTVDFFRDGRERSLNMRMGEKKVQKWVMTDDQEKEKNQEIDVEVIIKEWAEKSPVGRQVMRDMEDPSMDMDFFSVYPNPSNGRFNLRFTPREDGPIQVRVFSTAGRTVYMEQLTDFNGTYDKEIDLTDQPKGTFILQITQGDKGMAKRLVVR
jgi:S1-C subfamily serine protease